MCRLNASECKHHHPHHHYHHHRIINADEDGHADSFKAMVLEVEPRRWRNVFVPFLRHHSDEELLLVQRQLYTRASRAPFFLAGALLPDENSGQVFCHDTLKKSV